MRQKFVLICIAILVMFAFVGVVCAEYKYPGAVGKTAAIVLKDLANSV